MGESSESDDDFLKTPAIIYSNYYLLFNCSCNICFFSYKLEIEYSFVHFPFNLNIYGGIEVVTFCLDLILHLQLMQGSVGEAVVKIEMVSRDSV